MLDRFAGAVFWRRIGIIFAGPFLALAASALSEIGVALAAPIIALIATRDLYVAALAPSYGPFAAAIFLQVEIPAVALFSVSVAFFDFLRARNTFKNALFTAAQSGVGAAAMWLCLAISEFISGRLPFFIRVYTPVTYTLPIFAAAIIFGAGAGALAERFAGRFSTQNTLAHAFWQIFFYALLTSFAAQSVIAVQTALNLSR